MPCAVPCLFSAVSRQLHSSILQGLYIARRLRAESMKAAQLLRAGVLGASGLAARSHVALLRGFEAPGTVQRNTRESKLGVKHLMGCSSQ